MKKNNNRIFLIFLLFLSIFFIDYKSVGATSTEVNFEWVYTGDSSRINLSNLESMMHIVFSKVSPTGDFATYENFYNLGSYFVVYNGTYYAFYYNYTDYLPLWSYVNSSGYHLEIPYSYVVYFNSDFTFHSFDGNYGYYTIYTSGTYSHLQDSENLFQMNFNLIAGNHDFKLFNRGNTTQSYNSNFETTFYRVNGYKLKDIILSPFNDYGLIDNQDYSQTLTYTFNSNDSTGVKIFYDVLEGSVTNTTYEVSNNWFKRFFGIKDKITTTIDTDNFSYYVTSTNEILSPVRYYTDKKKENYKRLPRDTELLKGTSFSANVNTLNYNDGVRGGYIYFDLSSAPADTIITLTVEYNPISLKFRGLEKSDSFDSLTEVNLKDYYAAALIPKFNLNENFYSFPIYYKGNAGFSYGGNLKTSTDTSFHGIASGNSSDYSKFLIDFSKLSVVDGDSLIYYNKPYVYIRNLSLGNDLFIRYNSSYFDITYFTSDNSCQVVNDIEYCATKTDDWKWAGIDTAGNGDDGTTFTKTDDSFLITWGSSDSDSDSLISSAISNTSKVIDLLTGGFKLLAEIISYFQHYLPSSLVFVLDAILTITGFAIIINFVKKIL